MILNEERTTEEERRYIMEARKRAMLKRKKLRTLGKSRDERDTERGEMANLHYRDCDYIYKSKSLFPGCVNMKCKNCIGCIYCMHAGRKFCFTVYSALGT